MLSAPDGHLATVSKISFSEALSTLIQGFSLGRNTELNDFTQTPECAHFSGFHKIVLVDKLYFLVIQLFISNLIRIVRFPLFTFHFGIMYNHFHPPILLSCFLGFLSCHWKVITITYRM